MNDYIKAINGNKYQGNSFKQEVEELIGWYIKQALTKGTLKPLGEVPCVVVIKWSEKTKRRDADNVQSSQKFILDSLQKQGVLKKDSRKYVKQIIHEIVEGQEDEVRVELHPYNKQKWEWLCGRIEEVFGVTP